MTHVWGNYKQLHAILAGWSWYERSLGAVQKGRTGSGRALWWHKKTRCLVARFNIEKMKKGIIWDNMG